MASDSKRADTPLANTPDLATAFKKINADAAARKAAAAATKKVRTSKGLKQAGGSIQGLESIFGKKIITK